MINAVDRKPPCGASHDDYNVGIMKASNKLRRKCFKMNGVPHNVFATRSKVLIGK